MLTINKINFFLIYIGDVLENKNIYNILNYTYNNEKKIIELFNYFKIKNDKISNIQNIYNDLKKTVLKFEKKLEYIFDDKTIKNSLENSINTESWINHIPKLTKSIENIIKLKLSICFYIMENEDENIINKLKKKIEKLFEKFFELRFYIIKNVKNCEEFLEENKNLSIVFIAKIENYFYIISDIDIKKDNILLLAYKGENFIFQNINDFPKRFLNINFFTEIFINKFIKENKYNFEENQILNNNNFSKKINQDLNLLFSTNNLTFNNERFIIAKNKFKLDKFKKEDLLKFFEKISKLFNFNNTNKNILNELKNDFENNVNKLIENLYCKYCYYLYFYVIKKKVNEKIKKDYITSFLNKFKKENERYIY